MRKRNVIIVTIFALACASAIAGYIYYNNREEQLAVHSIMAAAMLYNVRHTLHNNEFVEFHWLDSGRLAACGLSFTAISAPGNTTIASATPGRAEDICSARGDIVYTSDQ